MVALVMNWVCVAPCGFTALHHCSSTTAVTRYSSLRYKHEGKPALIHLPCGMFQIYQSPHWRLFHPVINQCWKRVRLKWSIYCLRAQNIQHVRKWTGHNLFF